MLNKYRHNYSTTRTVSDEKKMGKRMKISSSGGSSTTHDYITDLPDDLIHHIYSFMDMKLVVQTSILSKKWRDHWKSSPTLDLHLDYFIPDQNPHPQSLAASVDLFTSKGNPRARSFIDFVDHVFRVREVSKMQKFSITSHEHIKLGHISRWLGMARAQNVEEVHLSLVLCETDTLELPPKLLTSVRILSLQNFPLPSWVCSTKLIKSLKLVSVRLPNGDSHGHLNFSCPVLECLVLTFCGISHLEILTISTPLLRNFELNTAITCITNIFCPNLQSFKCSSFICETLAFIENPLSLVRADIEIFPYDDTEEEKLFYANCSRNVLEGIYNIQSLTLCDFFLKTMFLDHPDLLEWVPNLFHNLKYMLVKDWDSGVCINALANILKRLPRIETLVWERNKGPSSQIMKEIEVVVNSGESIFCSLEMFEIRNVQLDMDELMFVKFLLRRAISLKKMILVITSAHFASGKLRKFKQKVLALPRASSSLSVSFLLRGADG